MRGFKTVSLIGFLFLVPKFVSSQTTAQDIEAFLSDMVFISAQYVQPAAEASVFQSTTSWFSSAKSLQKFEFDISIHANTLFIPTNQKNFSVSNSDFESLTIRNASSAEIPTAVGGDTSTFFDFFIDEDPYELQAFEGVKLSVIPNPFVQASVGLWKGTELTVRYAPKIKIDKSGFAIFGGGLKHNLSQYFSSNDGFNLAVFAGYSVFDLEVFFNDFKIQSTDPLANSAPLATFQSLGVDAETLLVQLIGSQQWARWEFTGALGVSRSDYSFMLKGSGIVDVFNQALSTLEDSTSAFEADFGVNYHFENSYIATQFSVGKFFNANLGYHYKF